MKNKKLLKVGDVIALKKGMAVYCKIPECFVYTNRKLSNEITENVIKVGVEYDNFTNVNDDILSLCNDIVGAFGRVGQKITLNQAKKIASCHIKLPKHKTFTMEEGEFLVVKADSKGGGFGHGQHDVYPDGWEITCKRLNNGKYNKDGQEVRFYQTGSFSAMIESIEPIRTMEMSFC